ncbi:MAG: hypothetical protein M3R59_06220 [Verrucomicrobiota bacterium]|nr:hypothetical protein [Verrucomicrobiota bacterium]
MSFLTTGIRELGLKVRRQRTRLALRHVKRQLQRSEIHLGREGTAQAVNFPEVRNEIVALKKLEQEQREVATRIAQLEEGLKQTETKRRENGTAKSEAIGKLETEKKPLQQARDEAKRATDLCGKELSGVEAHLQANDASDRDLLKQISALQAQTPPPADLDARLAALSSQRARLPEERTEIARAREGSADACRQAKAKLTAAEETLAVAEKNITRGRAEFDATDRELGEQSRAQQAAIDEARGHHDTVEEKKDPAYLNIGRHLGNQGIAPPSAPHLLRDVLRHRQSVNAHLAHRDELKVISAGIDRQDLRKFYFTVVSVVLLLALVVVVLMQRPTRHEWLPAATETILALNVEKFDRDDAIKKWRKESPEFWQTTWPALLGPAAQTPKLKMLSDTARVTRASTAIDRGEFVLVEAKDDVAPVARTLTEDKKTEKREVDGLTVWQQGETAIARLGPRTLAIGPRSGVDDLVRVRLGILPDLPLESPFFTQFQALDRDSALRLISREPSSLARVFHPIFPDELLQHAQTLGLALSLSLPVKAHLVLEFDSVSAAGEMAKNIRADANRWLQIAQSDMKLTEQPPEVKVDGDKIELRFNVPENSARLLLQRIAKTDAPVPTIPTTP